LPSHRIRTITPSMSLSHGAWRIRVSHLAAQVQRALAWLELQGLSLARAFVFALCRCCLLPKLPAMAPHLSPTELDFIFAQVRLGKTMQEIRGSLGSKRARRGLKPPGLSTVRKAAKGVTHKRSVVETRGRKKKLSPKVVRNMNKVRKALQKTKKGLSATTWATIIKKSKAPKVHRSTALKAFAENGINVRLRPSRAKPIRTKDHVLKHHTFSLFIFFCGCCFSLGFFPGARCRASGDG
jgi:hypothetical protein